MDKKNDITTNDAIDELLLDDLNGQNRYHVRRYEDGHVLFDTMTSAVVAGEGTDNDLSLTSATQMAAVLNSGDFDHAMLEALLAEADIVEHWVTECVSSIPTLRLGDMHTVSVKVGHLRQLRESYDELVKTVSMMLVKSTKS